MSLARPQGANRVECPHVERLRRGRRRRRHGRLVLAARLSEEPGRTVCLVEAGPDYGRFADGRWPADMLDARILPMTHLWERDADDRSASRARIIGGCSAHNACLVVWGSRADYDEWGPGWTFAELEPYLPQRGSGDRDTR